MNNDKDLPIYQVEEQGLSDDVRFRTSAAVEQHDRRIRNAVDRSALISRLNEDGTAATTNSLAADTGILRVVIYLRVSTEEQASVGGEAEGYSIPSQRDGCLGKARAMGAIVAEEYVEAGESAKSADRPELQRMLRELKSRRVDYVIVHKIDRLARNRADDVEINAAIARAGAKLISVSEPVDDTPAGRLLYNMMADVAQYHSDNLAVEVLKGMDKKAQLGGTPYRCPIGYLNKTEIRDGVRFSWIVIDSERAPLVRWALEEYATGEWTVRQLELALDHKGLRTRASRKRISRPLAVQTIHRMLRNPYYFGVVPYRGIYYEGKHGALISTETWLQIQNVLKSHNVAGEKTRKYPHYLKGTIRCGECGERLVYSRNRGNGGVYEYFICLSRKTRRRHCSRTVTRLDKIEVGVCDFYARFRLHPYRAQAIREAVRIEMAAERQQAQETGKRAASAIRVIKEEREKLLRAYYANAVPDDLLKSEMDRLTREMAAADKEQRAAVASMSDLDATLDQALRVAGGCDRQYVTAPPRIRRQINQGLFTGLYIGRDGEVERHELTEPFAQLLDPALGTRLAPAPGSAQDADRGALPSRVLDATTEGADTKIAQNGVLGDGLHIHHLVPPTGFEPALPP